MKGKPIILYSKVDEGEMVAKVTWRCPRDYPNPTPCVGCTAKPKECSVAALFKGTIKPPGYGLKEEHVKKVHSRARRRTT